MKKIIVFIIALLFTPGISFADSKITELDAMGAAPDGADLLYIIDDVAGTPTSKKITIDYLFLSPTFVTPTLGTIASGDGAALTGLQFDQFITQTAWRVFYSNTDGDVTELALGADGTYLMSNGAAVAPTFETPSGSGDVTKVGTPVDNQVGVWTGNGTLEGDTDFTFDGDELVVKDFAPVGDVDLTGSNSLSSGVFDVTDTYMALRATTTATDYFELGAYDVDGTAYKGLIRFVSGNTVYGFLGDNETNAWRWDEDGNLEGQGTASISGRIKSLTPVTDSTADFAANFTGEDLYGGTFVANADDGDLQLPAVAAGMNFTIITLGAIEVVVEPNASDSMLLDGVQLDDADSATNTSTAGDIIVFQYYSAAGWIATSNSWTDED